MSCTSRADVCPSQLMGGALRSQCFSSDVAVFNDANTTENNPDLGEYHACSAGKGDVDCPGSPGAYICRLGWVRGPRLNPCCLVHVPFVTSLIRCKPTMFFPWCRCRPNPRHGVLNFDTFPWAIINVCVLLRLLQPRGLSLRTCTVCEVANARCFCASSGLSWPAPPIGRTR